MLWCAGGVVHVFLVRCPLRVLSAFCAGKWRSLITDVYGGGPQHTVLCFLVEGGRI